MIIVIKTKTINMGCFLTIIYQNKGSTWANKYWNEGAEAARVYCREVCEQIDKVTKSLTALPVYVAEKPEATLALQKLVKTLANTKANYSEDVYVSEKLWSKGRMEPGRTPFNYPSFHRRYLHQKDLDEHIQHKIKKHQKSWNRLEQLLKLEELPNKEDLRALQNYHAASVQKWKGRVNSRTEHLQKELGPSSQTPLDILQISELHDRGYFGQGSRVIIIEAGVDTSHSGLQDAIVNPQKINVEDEHGTHVCGIIAAKKHTSPLHIGVAPSVKLAIDDNTNDQIVPIAAKFMNWSGSFVNPFIALIKETDEKSFNLKLASEASRLIATAGIKVGMVCIQILQMRTIEEKKAMLSKICEALQLFQINRIQSMMRDKLLFQSLGNSGVDISHNDKESSLKSRYQNIEHLVFVVNLLWDGCTPHASTNFPGDRFKKMTVCAIGTDVLSTVPGDEYKELTGTSMATPFVTGIAALLEGAYPKLTLEEIRDCIFYGATPIVIQNGRPILVKNFDKQNRPEPNPYFGWGLISGVGAFNQAKEIMDAKSG
jgi:subtilisin family serine protease